MKNCIVKITDNDFKKMPKEGYFLYENMQHVTDCQVKCRTSIRMDRERGKEGTGKGNDNVLV